MKDSKLLLPEKYSHRLTVESQKEIRPTICRRRLKEEILQNCWLGEAGEREWRDIVPCETRPKRCKDRNFTGALTQLPAPFDDLNVQLRKFSAKGLSARKMVTLVGAHTVGFMQCVTLFDDRNINPAMKPTLRCGCPVINNNTNLVPLDLMTPEFFDKFYYNDLIRNQGLFFSDQVLMGSSVTADVVRTYNSNSGLFLREFNDAMMKMGDLPPSRRV
ncbi:Neutral peroxidase [Capsicum baccatum]|uniref:peroxidase n=1 Tax=Capsicum baccatum TaxID=33114 RepID=A0A2G2V3X5_CAPBA|nr:Neutral peroxidase [Capsicum baccatum]